MATATVIVWEPLPIRRAALKQIVGSFDPNSLVEGEVKEPDQHLKKKAKANKTPRTPSHEGSPNREPKFRETPPSSPEYDAKPKKTPKKNAKPRDLFSLLGDPKQSQKRAYVKKPKAVKRDETSDDDDLEPEVERRGERLWFEGVATPEDMDLTKLIFTIGNYFIGKYKILCLLSLSEEKGATYIAYRNHYEVVLRVNFIQRDDMELLNTEAKFLERMELNDSQHLFSTFFDMGIVNKEKADGMVFYASIYRGGPTLEQCHTLCQGRLSAETINRLASQMITIFEQICGQGYSILAFSPEDFTIDRRSRVLFLNNFTNIIKAEGIDDEEMLDITAGERKRRGAWEGDPDYAPVKWHQDPDNHVMTETDSIESLVYLLMHLATGTLPWSNISDKLGMKLAHSNTNVSKAIINYLPPSLKCLWLMILAEESPRVSFSMIHRMFSRYSVDDEDFCYDWESTVAPSEDQERLICYADAINDTLRRMGTMECIFENATKLAER